LNVTNANIGALTVTGNEVVDGTLTVGGAVACDSTFYAGGAVSCGSTLAVGGNTALNTMSANTINVTTLYASAFTNYGSEQINGNLVVGNTINAGSGVTASAFGLTDGYTALYSQNLTLYPGLVLNGGGGSFSFSASSGSIMEADPGGQLGIYGQAYKPGGGPWINSSDARIKTVQGPYELGLNEILDLKPVVYRFKGNDAAPGKQSRTAADRSFVGLVAQEVESVFPGMVTRRKGHIDGREVDDLRDLDTNELIFALVNAVKTLAAEVAELKAR
jgi:hypothetical protein